MAAHEMSNEEIWADGGVRAGATLGNYLNRTQPGIFVVSNALAACLVTIIYAGWKVGGFSAPE